MSDLSSFVGRIPQNGILSLDIFDTAVTRKVAIPTHIFAIIQGAMLARCKKRSEKFLWRNFIEMRIRAERESRANGSIVLGETTLDRIYKKLGELDKNFIPFIDEIKILEIETELAEAVAIPEIKKIYDDAVSHRNEIIFTSDMYLPLHVIEQILQKCGYSEYQKIFLSSEFQKTKGHGDLWEEVLRSVGKGHQIFHIGDNWNSDVRRAKENGIQAFHFPNYSTGHKKYAGFSNAIIPLSRLIAKTRNDVSSYNVPVLQKDTLSEIARTHLPLLLGSYIKWIDEQVRLQGVKTIYFLSRDGWILKRTWESLEKQGVVTNGLQIVYAEISRRALWMPTIKQINEEVLNRFLLGGLKPNRPVRVFLERIGIQITESVELKVRKFFSSSDEIIPVAWQCKKLSALIHSLETEIVDIAAKERKLALGYLHQIGFFDTSGKKAIVDLGWHASMQAMLVKLLEFECEYPKHNIIGLYTGLFQAAQRNIYRGGYAQGMICTPFSALEEQRRLQTTVQLLEILHMAPHGSVTGYKINRDNDKEHFSGLYVENENEMMLYRNFIEPMHEAAIKTLVERLIDKTITWDALTPQTYLETWLDLSIHPAANEAKALGNFLHWDGIEHSGEGTPLIPSEIPMDFASANSLLSQTGYWRPGLLCSWSSKRCLPQETLLKLTNSCGHLGGNGKAYFRQLISQNELDKKEKKKNLHSSAYNIEEIKESITLKYLYLVPPYSPRSFDIAGYCWSIFKWVHNTNAASDSIIIAPESYRKYFENPIKKARGMIWGLSKNEQEGMGYNINEDDLANGVHIIFHRISSPAEKEIEENPHLRFVNYVLSENFAGLNYANILTELRDAFGKFTIITWLNSVSLKQTAKELGLPIIFNEIGPLRKPFYRQTAFFDFSGVNGNTSARAQWESQDRTEDGRKRFIQWCDKNNINKRKIQTLLAPTINPNDFTTKIDTELGVALQVEDDSNTLLYSNKWTSLSLLASVQDRRDSMRVRLHPGGLALYRGNIDLSKTSLHFCARCKKIITINSSVGIEAVFWGKPVRFFGENPITFLFDVPDEEKPYAWIYFFLGYLIPWEMLFDRNYYDWRINKNPGLPEIAEAHLNYYKSLPRTRKSNPITFQANDSLYKERIGHPMTDFLPHQS